MAPAPRPLAPAWLWPPLAGWMALIWWGSSLPGSDLPGVFDLFPHFDKALHIVEYAGLGWLAARVIGRWPLGSAAALLAITAAFALLHGLVDEIHQSTVPHREFDLGDLAADLAGGVIGAAVWIQGRRWRRVARWW